MPTYSYACTECDDRFDAVQAFTDDALTTCTKCSGRLRKLFSSVGVVFKGSGFYRTDSREAAKSTVASNSNGSATSDGSKSEGSKSEGSKSEGSKSEGSKSEGSKSESSSDKKSSSSEKSSSSTSSTPSPAASK